MISREKVQKQINSQKDLWGKCGYPDWNKLKQGITQTDVIEAGIRHACPVIPTVINRDKTPVENWKSYQLKNYSFSAVGDTFDVVRRPDLRDDWDSIEVKKFNEKTDPSLKDEVMYPQDYDPRILPAPTRTSQVLYADLFRNLAQTADGERPDIADTSEKQARFELPLNGLTQIASSAADIQDFTATMGAHTAKVLQNSGVEKKDVLTLLVGSFAKPGLIKETGQLQPAKDMVTRIALKMADDSSLQPLAIDFLNLAYPKLK